MEGPPQLLTLPVLMLFWLGAWACVGVWIVLVHRLWRGQAVLPLRPRRRVPWGGIDLVLVVVVAVSLSRWVDLLARVVLGPDAGQSPPIYNVEQRNTVHMVVRLFSEGDTLTILLCGLSAAVVPPLVEEFLFRVLFQGWLEVLDRRLRPRMPVLRRLVSWGTGPVVLASFLFAMAHFRIDSPPRDPAYLRFMMIGNAAVMLLAAVFAVVLVRVRTGATAVDLGWVGKRFAADVGLGLTVFAAIGVPTYLGQLALLWLLPRYLAPDVFALFFFALVLGTLYCRTHRVVPSIVLHMSLNITSLLILWLSMPSG